MKNIVPQRFAVTQADRSKAKGHEPLLLWFTGLSGSGKSTIANAVEEALVNQGIHTYILDGDNVRDGLNNNLSFSAEDRTENIRRIAEVSKLMMDAGLFVLAAFVSPYLKDRENVKNTVGDDRYVEIFVNTPIAECENRDVKGLYKRARAGEIKDFTGINAPYEAPVNPSIEIDTTQVTIEASVEMVLEFMRTKLNI